MKDEKQKGDSTKRGRAEMAPFFMDVKRLKTDPLIIAVYRCARGLPGGGEQKIFLVGGVTRNIFLKRDTPPDYDFAVDGSTEIIARAAAGVLGGSAFLLDKKELLYRVAVKIDARQVTLDFSILDPGGINSDLRKRDFTVNAIGLDLGHLFECGPVVTDPAGGIGDCAKKLLRMTGPGVFASDPLRCVRAVRIALQYGLTITGDTRERITLGAHLLKDKKTSPERIRDELLQILCESGCARAIKDLYEFGIIKAVIPEIAAWGDVRGYDLLGHTLRTLTCTEAILGDIESGVFPYYAPALKAHFFSAAGPVGGGVILKLGALFHDAGKPLTMAFEEGKLRFIGHDLEGSLLVAGIMKRLRFSRRTTGRVAALVRNHHRVFTLADLKTPTPRAKAHFFRAAGAGFAAAGLDLLMLAMADARATRGGEDPELFKLVGEMLRFYFEVYVKKPPRPLLNGREVMKTFNVAEGRIVGEIIDKISEGVEFGAVSTRADAVEFIRQWLNKRKG